MAKTIVKNIRFSYPKLFKRDDNGKYSMQLLIPKDNKQATKAVFDAVEAAKLEGKDRLGKNYQSVKSTIHDGDGEKPTGGEYNPECHDCYVMNVSSKDKPEIIVGRDKLPAEEDDIRPGDWGCVELNFKAYNTGGNKGITAYLNRVWKTKDGERLGGSSGGPGFDSIDTDDIDFGDDIDPITGLAYDSDEIPY